MFSADLLSRIRSLIAEDHLEEVIQLLLSTFESTEKIDEIVILSARYQAIARENGQGKLNHEETQKQLNQLRSDLLVVVRKIESASQKAENHADPELELKGEYHLSLARISVLWLLNKASHLEAGLPISQIYELSGIKKRKHIISSLQELENVGLISKYKSQQLVYWKLSPSGKDFAEELSESTFWGFREKE